MATTINTNMSSLMAQRALGASQGSLSTSMQRLSTGLRINSAKDDSAGLAIAERMTSQVKGMAVASRNANDAISLAQTAEGALGKIGESLQRMRELAVQSSNSTNSTSDRANLNEEYTALAAEVTRVIDGTKFNGNNLLNTDTGMAFQVGADAVATDAITVNLTDISGGTGMALVLDTAGTTGSISTAAVALATMSNLDAAIDEVTSARSNLGSVQNRFESVVANLATTSENLQAAKGRILDADFAVETSNMSRAQVLQQAGNAMLAQANQAPQQVMSLLR
ncbi:flagellin [Sphaerotilus sp.]|uniref:flagellin N-terminal helical domain-containing protein n=1 Tax=Sphaerotilus sp. TaxID=2093942 RepID=UPI002ACF08D2|nr:flagellin [Sphaerotilus sp.]MDZ7857632.1 flagellin [Sphaerotilus sp.]